MKVKKLLLLGLMTAIGTSLSAGTVKMKTSRAAGQNISFAVNSGLSLTLTWGDGSTEQLTSTGQLQTVSVKNEQLTISSEKDITSLYVAENDLTTLDISGSAKTLRTLCCADNQLTTLSLTGCTNLVILDCQGNQLKSVSNPSSKMQDLNVADNQLTSHGLSSVANLLSMVCANNNMTSIGSLANMVNLTSLFCQGNKITGFTKLDNLVNLKHIIASNNNLKSLNLSTLTQLEDLWVSDNQLTTLDLSTTKKLVGLVAANNQLNTITWDYVSARKNVKYADVSKNILPFNSLPNLYNTTVGTYVVDGAVGPQNPVELIAGSIEVNQKAGSDFTTRIVRSGWNNITKPEVKAEEAAPAAAAAAASTGETGKEPEVKAAPAEEAPSAPQPRDDGKPVQDPAKCVYCTLCARNCPAGALKVDRKAKTWELDEDLCVACGTCQGACPKDAIIM